MRDELEGKTEDAKTQIRDFLENSLLENKKNQNLRSQ